RERDDGPAADQHHAEPDVLHRLPPRRRRSRAAISTVGRLEGVGQSVESQFPATARARPIEPSGSGASVPGRSTTTAPITIAPAIPAQMSVGRIPSSAATGPTIANETGTPAVDTSQSRL